MTGTATETVPAAKVTRMDIGSETTAARTKVLAPVQTRRAMFTNRDEKGSPVVIERVQKFPIKAGRSEVRNGKMIFPDTQRRPQLPSRTIASLLERN